MIYQWVRNIRSCLLPSTCLLCGASGEADRNLCRGCHADLPYNPTACARCAAPLPTSSGGDQFCGRCQRTPPAFDRAVAPLLYLPPVDFLVHQLKFHGRLTAARLLGELLGEALMRRSGPLPEAIVPVPLHRRRLRERGFNQAIEVARPVARRLQLPLLIDGVDRIQPAPPQSTLDLKARRSNLKGAFAVRDGIAARRLAILDDVITTGSTADELARVLRRAGAVEIEVWACTRTPG